MKQTFLYAVCGVILITAFSGCAGINALLKSGQPDLIYSKALELSLIHISEPTRH